jgi:hypothetical protein
MTHCFRRLPIAMLADFRSLELGLHSSGSYGYHFRSSPAPERLQIPPALAIPVSFAG